MSARERGAFGGFSPQTLRFLAEAHERNSRRWFEANRSVYDEHVLSPLRALVVDLSAAMGEIDRRFEMRPQVGRTISRIFRDIRFSRDKSIFRDHMWIVFKRPSKEWTDRPGFFFEVGPEMYRFGMGYYSASKATMDAIRADIDRDPSRFLDAISFYPRQRVFVLGGEEYKRPPKGAPGPPLDQWYRRRTLHLICERAPDRRLFSPALAADLERRFATLAPLYRYFIDLHG
jgi:uncharacterized protein (TIGR02453 family)